MNLLQQKIIRKIKSEGPVTFKIFMEMALYDPEFGYYMTSDIRIGKAGDFYTSSHRHPVFGAMLAKQIEEMWEIMDRPTAFQVVEMGSGAGYLCKDILNYLRNCELFNSLNYIIVEINPLSMEKQKSLLKEFSDKITWVSSLSEINNIKGCIFSNELLDAFPVHLIETGDELKEIFVDAQGNKLYEIQEEPSTDALAHYLREFSVKSGPGYRTEINLEIKKWLNEINSILTEGFILTIDYGYPAHEYYSEERNNGTLLCYHKHQVNENPFQNIGEQDITSHVNFSSLKKWSDDLGIKTLGFCQQAVFLLSLGIEKEIVKLYEESPDYFSDITKIKGLILPGTMGETHKVMIQYKGSIKPELRGFSIKNQEAKL